MHALLYKFYPNFLSVLHTGCGKMLFAIRKMFLLIKKLLLLIHKMLDDNTNMLVHDEEL